MQAIADSDILDQMLDPVAQCLTTEAARRLVSVRITPDVQARIDALAAKANEGELSPEERAAYAAYVEAIDFVAVLQSKARAMLADSDASR